jgi:nitric oxide reductase NorD protein
VHEPTWIRRQKEGPEIDLDAATQYLVERLRGGNPEDRLYTRKSRQPGDVSGFFLLDQSLSTDSWVEGRRVLDVMTEAIGVSGLLFEGSIRDVQVAGIWSATRHHCSYQVLKSRQESWEAYFGRVSKIEPRGYTRMGPAIRHATESFKNSETRRRLLVFLTDGKPTDLDHYEGTHGIYDVKKACEEAEKSGIVPYAMTIERERKSHFPVMFKNFSIVHTPEMFSEALVRLLSKVVSQGISP